MDSDSECSDTEAWVDFEDMVFDWDRNEKYRVGIEKAVKKKVEDGEDPSVLDIGSGSGLLSFYSAKAGSSTVTALEMDSVIYKTSLKISQRNSLDDKITFINKISTEYEGPKSNILVSEMVDSELIGENLIPTYRHALQNLLNDKVISVPALANIYIVPIESKFLTNYVKIPSRISKASKNSNNNTSSSSEVFCDAEYRGIEGQWSQLQNPEDIKWGSDKVLVKSFDLSSLESVALNEEFDLKVEITKDITRVDGLLFYWDLDMTGDGSVIVSTEPGNSAWRNHWLPMLFPFSAPITVKQGDKLPIKASHDPVSYWFTPVTSTKNEQTVRPKKEESLKRKECSCDWHSIVSLQTIFRWNQYEESEFVKKVSEISKDKNVLIFGSHSILPSFITNAESVTSIDGDVRFQRKYNSILEADKGSGDHKCLKECVEDVLQVDLNVIDAIIFDVLSEPLTSPFELVEVYSKIRRRYGSKGKVQCFPEICDLKLVQLKLGDLAKRRANYSKVDEFDYQDFADLCQPRTLVKDYHLELHPMWEYENQVLRSEAIFSFLDDNPAEELEIEVEKNTDAFVLYWYAENDDIVVKDSLIRNDKGTLEWRKGDQQWITFRNQNGGDRISINFDFDNWGFTISDFE